MKHFGMAKKDLLDLCMVASGCIFADEDEAVKIRERVEAFREDIGLGNGTRAKQLGK